MASISTNTSGERRIGFLTTPHPVPAATPQRAHDPAALLQFDDGEVVNFEDARHNCLVLGTTGSGKTASIILPAAERLIAAGFGGFVVDIKGNFTDQIRAIARAHGRKRDILELGTSPQARKVNLLAGASAQRMHDILQQFMSCSAAPDDHNRAFHLRGLRCVVDALLMLHMMAERGKLPMHLCVLERLMNDEEYARDCLKRFCRSIQDEDDPEAHDLVKRIKGDQFHFISEGVPKDMHTTWQEQVGYRLGVIRTTLQLLHQSRNLMDQFFAPGKPAPNMARAIHRQRKIVVLRLAADSGELGAVLARTLLRDYYASVYAHGLQLPEGQYTFCITDEAQDFISVNRLDQYNDNSFLARNREFRNISIMGTQSVAALVARTHDAEAVEAMLNNFNVRVFFYSDDPLTQRLADMHDQTPLTAYRRGEGLLVRIDAAAGRRVVGRVSVQAMHDALQGILTAHRGRCVSAALPCRAPSRRQMLHKAQRERALEEAYLHMTPQPRQRLVFPRQGPFPAQAEAESRFAAHLVGQLPFGPNNE